MVKVNLLSKKRQSSKNKNIASIVGLTVFGLFTLYFLIQVVVLLFGLISINQKLTKTKKETENLSAQMLKDNEKLNKFILSKFILGEVIKQRSKQFDYIGYLSQISTILPPGTELTGIDFQTQGFAAVKTITDDSNALKLLESSVKKADLATGDFSGVILKGISRLDDGSFSSELFFGLKKKNGGK